MASDPKLALRAAIVFEAMLETCPCGHDIRKHDSKLYGPPGDRWSCYANLTCKCARLTRADNRLEWL